MEPPLLSFPARVRCRVGEKPKQNYLTNCVVGENNSLTFHQGGGAHLKFLPTNTRKLKKEWDPDLLEFLVEFGKKMREWI
jgi:hypothetical protein